MPVWTIGKIGNVEVDYNSDDGGYTLHKLDRLGFRYGTPATEPSQGAAEGTAATLNAEVDADRALEDFNTTTTAANDATAVTNLSSALAWIGNTTGGTAYFELMTP